MARVTPRIHAEGRYELKTPWAETMPPATVFVCEAIRTFPEIEQEDVSVYETYYMPYGLTKGDHAADAREDACIITLVSQDRQTIIFVPDTYILYAPSDDAVNCDHIVLSLNCGVVPGYLDLTAAKLAVSAKLKEILGVDTPCIENRVPSVRTVTQADNDIAEASRHANIIFQQSLEAQIRAKDARIAELSGQLDDAYTVMRDNGLIQDE